MGIVFQGVTKYYRGNFSLKRFKAVENVNLAIAKGEIFGIVGPNGAGKSTLIKMLMGFIRSTSGSIEIMGRSPLDPEIKRKIGYLPENPYYYDHLTAEELLRFSARTSGMGRTEMNKRIDSLLTTMSLSHARKRKLRGYSKGMTQRAGICFALVHDPDFVILDEPMSGLDPIGRKDVVNLVLGLKERGKTVLFCSHILNDVQKICDKMAIMNKGRLRKVMARDEIENTGKGIAIVCSRLPQAFSKSLDELGCALDETETGVRIHCPKVELNGVLEKLKAYDVDILDITTSVDTLEDFFLKTIRDGDAE